MVNKLCRKGFEILIITIFGLQPVIDIIKKIYKMKKTYFTIIVASVSAILIAQAPAGYYDSANGKTDRALKTALSSIITNGHIDKGYGSGPCGVGLWQAYQTTDIDVSYEADGTILDIYSEKPNGTEHEFIPCTDQDQGSGGTAEGQYYNREHMVPQSLFSKATPMKNDVNFVRATDKYINGQRGDMPFGDVGAASQTFSNGSKIGNCSDTGFSGSVFEPINEFKGDVARMIFYFATRYESQLSTFSAGIGPQLGSSAYPGLATWYLSVMLNWSANDPVSQAEISRNNATYNYQGNRNPFIDHPELAEYIWGNKIGYVWNITSDVIDIEAIPVRIIYNKQSSSIQIICEQTFDSFAIINISGQTIESGTVNSDFIQINQLADGLYFVVLNSNLGRIAQKLLVY